MLDLDDATACEARAEVVADALGVDPPRRVLDDRGEVTPDFLKWGQKHGVCFTYIMCGDVAMMIRAVAEAKRCARGV